MMYNTFYDDLVVALKEVSAKRTGGAGSKPDQEIKASLHQFLRMETLGRVSAAVAHDFNRMLTVILCYTDLLLQQASSDPMRGELEEILKAANRATRLTGQILTYSHKQTPRPTVLDLNVVLAEMNNMLRSFLNPDIELLHNHEPNLNAVWADLGQVEQVIMNLVLNARDAMPRGGAITLVSSNVFLPSALIHHHGVIPPGNYVRINVNDNGSGMDFGTQSHLFDDFFTTKGPSKGTGLGLSIVQGVVRQAHGHIVVSSEPGKGSTFSIYFPQHAPEPAPRVTALHSCCV